MTRPADHSRGQLAAMFVVLGLIFVSLAIMVKTRTAGWLDDPIISLVDGHRTAALTAIMKLATDLGSFAAIIIAVAVLVLGLLRRKKHYEYSLVVISVLGAVVLNAILKLAFNRVRPSLWSHLVVENGLSFPSGHAMASSALAISLVYLLWRTRWRGTAIVVGALYVLAVGISRVYLGVHYPSDVIAGWCVSWLWVGLVAHWLVAHRDLRRQKA